MIKKVLYTDNTTYLTGNENSICDNNTISTTVLSFIEAFEFAKSNNADFDFQEISKVEIEEMSKYLIDINTNNTTNRDIYLFMEECEDNNIHKLLDIPQENLKYKWTKQILHDILTFYRDSAGSMNWYGTDHYIASLLFDILYTNESNAYKDERKELLSVFVLNSPIQDINDVDFYDYDLNRFLEILSNINAQIEQPINKYREAFKESWECSSSAIEEYIGGIVTYGGDATVKIYKAMLEVLDDIENDTDNGGYIVDKQGFIDAIQGGEYLD